jgi:hypothetical protein
MACHKSRQHCKIIHVHENLCCRYNLLGRVNGLPQIKVALNAYVKRTGVEMVTNEERDKDLVCLENVCMYAIMCVHVCDRHLVILYVYTHTYIQITMFLYVFLSMRGCMYGHVCTSVRLGIQFYSTVSRSFGRGKWL